MLSAPAQATRLQSWRFDVNQNRLVFTTDDSVQPRAQLLSNPTRLVIDLPGVTLGSPMLNQTIGDAIREVRLGQFDAQTTRIVIELSPGYTLDPQQVLVRGSSPTQWTVQLPTPQPIAGATAPAPPTAPAPTFPAIAAPTQIEGLRVTPDGFFLRFQGAAPEIDIDRSRDRRQITIDLEDTAISPQLVERVQTPNQLGVERLELAQVETAPPVTRITLDLAEAGAEWQATASNLGGIVLVPQTGRSPIASDDRDPPAQGTIPAQSEVAIVQSVQLGSDGTSLQIIANRPITYSSGWDRTTGAYQVTIPAARLAERVTGPQLGRNSPLLNVRLRENSDGTVTILMVPASGVQIQPVNPVPGQVATLQLQRANSGIVVQPPPGQPPLVNPPTIDLPRNRAGQVVVVIDPGHGGRDPGAIGIGGIHEADIVLPVGLQVAALLQEQGVNAVLTRSDDREIELEPRVQIAERADADLFVSIHANSISLSRPDVNGIETYYYSDSGLRFGQVIHNSMIQLPGVQDRGVRRARFYVIRNTSMPAVLLELGFVTGAQDVRLLADPEFRGQMAAAITRGILQYIQQNF
ncbi:MAG: N-acetylmuramoyl-L-alanine amidase [Leptolyngbyaceae cyanobacterium SL_7_1]|nr:N-acetylmuramoyl-L-alanine amidase [Leptolyngbyaceae cyanobacterium SL_7_1]